MTDENNIVGAVEDTPRARVVQEGELLDEKVHKLHNFVYSDLLKSVSPLQQALLRSQLYAMRSYSKILQTRLENWDI